MAEATTNIYFRLGSYKTQLPFGKSQGGRVSQFFDRNRDLIFLFLAVIAAALAVLYAYRIIPSQDLTKLYFKVGALSMCAVFVAMLAFTTLLKNRGCVVVEKVKKEVLSN